MILYLDSASTDDAKAAADLGLVAGITTNPALMAKASSDPEAQLRRLLEAAPSGPVFFQVGSRDHDTALEEALRARRLAPARVVAKLPATSAHYRLAATLRTHGMPVAMTAVYTPAQAVLSAQVGARYVITYVDRARRLRPDEAPVVGQIAAVLRSLPDRPLVMAASLKSPQQAVGALVDGADRLTLPLALLGEMAHDDLTEQAITEFEVASRAG